MYPGAQLLFNGVASGCATALLAVAFQIVYLPTRVFFLALAAIYSLAPFLASTFIRIGLPGWTAVAMAASCCALISLTAEYISHRRLARTSASSGIHLVASLGNYIVLVQVILIAWGNNPKTLRTGVDSTTQIAGLVITGTQWTMIATAALLLSGVSVFFRRSRIGLRLRALANNPEQFELYGYNLDNHRLLCFGLSGLLAAASSIVTANDSGFNPHSGLEPFLIAVVACIVMGQRSLTSPIIGALFLAVVRAQVAFLWSSRWQDAVTFGLLAVVLLFRPAGMLIGPSRLEAMR